MELNTLKEIQSELSTFDSITIDAVNNVLNTMYDPKTVEKLGASVKFSYVISKDSININPELTFAENPYPSPDDVAMQMMAAEIFKKSLGQ